MDISEWFIPNNDMPYTNRYKLTEAKYNYTDPFLKKELHRSSTLIVYYLNLFSTSCVLPQPNNFTINQVSSLAWLQ